MREIERGFGCTLSPLHLFPDILKAPGIGGRLSVSALRIPLGFIHIRFILPLKKVEPA